MYQPKVGDALRLTNKGRCRIWETWLCNLCYCAYSDLRIVNSDSRVGFHQNWLVIRIGVTELNSRRKISDIYFLCSVSLSNLITIQLSNLVFCSFFSKKIIHFCMIAYIYSLYGILLSMCLSRIVLFGLMTTRLNKILFLHNRRKCW